MNEQIGGRTAAYMQERFPFITINTGSSFSEPATVASLAAFYARLRLLLPVSREIQETGGYLTGDAGIKTYSRDPLTVDAMRHLVDRAMAMGGETPCGWYEGVGDEIA